MKLRSYLRTAASQAALGLALFMGPLSAQAQQHDSEQVSQLLTDAKGYAIQAENDAATLDSYTRSSVAWKSHVVKLASMKAHVNNMGKIVGQLNDLSSEASPWQQQAINQINPLLRDMADHLSGTISFLNEHQSQVHMPAFKEYVERNHELAARTAELVRDYVNYDEARSTAESLEQKLEIAEN